MKDVIIKPAVNALNLKIIDDFFSDSEYNILVNNLNRISYSPNTNEFGLYGLSHEFEQNKENKWIFDKIKNCFFPNNNKLEVLSAGFQMRDNKNNLSPHVDEDTTCAKGIYKNKFNCLIYLKGKEITYNGTGFYHKGNLNTYIGFVENRAIFFNGCDIYHTCLQGLGESSARYTLGIFYGVKK